MFDLSALELRLAFYGVLLAAIAGGLLYERHSGEAAIRAEDKAAAVAQHTQDLATNQGVVDELRRKLAALATPIAAPAPPPVMRLCIPPRYVRAGSGADGTQPKPVPDTGADTGVRGGGGSAVPAEQPGPDVRPLVQLVEDAGVLTGTAYGVLWGWSMKQAQKVPGT